MILKCRHKESGAEGIIKEEMNSFNPPQYGIYWIEKANYGKYSNHYYWNDKDKIEITMKNKTETTIMDSIILEELSDSELLSIADECQKDTWDENNIVRILAKQYFGGDSLTQMMLVSFKLLPVIAERMKRYSPHLENNHWHPK